jgi:cold shock CspA family protein/ribosome-associated translation inhibitor RaiA
MQQPLEINFHDVPRSDWSLDLIHERAARLERYNDHIISCHVIVAQPHHHQHKGRPYRVSLEVRLPRHQNLAVVEEPAIVHQGQANLRPVINGAFDTMERRLRSLGETSRRQTLAPAADEQRGLVVRLFEQDGYGFLRTLDEREIYFHRNAVLHDDFDRLAVGTEVRFEAVLGEEGPQATTVQLVNKPGERETDATRGRDDVPPGWRNTDETA